MRRDTTKTTGHFTKLAISWAISNGTKRIFHVSFLHALIDVCLSHSSKSSLTCHIRYGSISLYASYFAYVANIRIE